MHLFECLLLFRVRSSSLAHRTAWKLSVLNLFMKSRQDMLCNIICTNACYGTHATLHKLAYFDSYHFKSHLFSSLLYYTSRPTGAWQGGDETSGWRIHPWRVQRTRMPKNIQWARVRHVIRNAVSYSVIHCNVIVISSILQYYLLHALFSLLGYATLTPPPPLLYCTALSY